MTANRDRKRLNTRLTVLVPFVVPLCNEKVLNRFSNRGNLPLQSQEENNPGQKEGDLADPVFQGKDQRVVEHGTSVGDQPDIANPVEQQGAQKPDEMVAGV